jgi:hypothetical protein
VAAVWLVATAWAFLARATMVGYALEVTLALIPGINVTISHFCLLALTYRLLFDGWWGK